MDDARDWHRLFGMGLVDLFAGLPVTIELEKDLSLKRQFLDVALVRASDDPLGRRLPDGFEDLAAHNLISFKSYQEALDGWSLNELVGHYVNYHKQAGPSMSELLPEADFRLFAVCARTPERLMIRVPLEPVRAGVYRASHFTGDIRVIVSHELPLEEQNALPLLFSATEERVRYATSVYRQWSGETSTFLNRLFDRYIAEGGSMATLIEQLRDEYREALFNDKTFISAALRKATPDERLEGLSVEDRLKNLAPQELLKRVRDAARLKGLTDQEREEVRRLLAELDSPAAPEEPAD